MITLSQLASRDNSFEAIFGQLDSIQVKGISHVTWPLEDEFIFVKSKKYFDRIAAKTNGVVAKNSGIVLEKKFFEKMSDEQKQFVEKSFSWAATVENSMMAMTYFSKPFYEQKFDHLNYYLDGRQNDTVKISPYADIAQNVFIGSHVEIAEDVVIMPGVTILPHVKIGKGTIIFPNVTIYPYTTIAEHTRIHGGCVLGGDGFGYEYHQGAHHKIWHFSGVEIGSHVELGANSTVDAGAFYPTRIGDGTKVDNHSTIGHNCQLGKHVIVCGKGSIAGSAELDDYAMMGGMAGIGPDARIGKAAKIAASAIVSEGAVIEDGATVAGHPARPVGEWLKGVAFVRKQSLKK